MMDGPWSAVDDRLSISDSTPSSQDVPRLGGQRQLLSPQPTILEPRHLTACFAHGTASIRIRQQHQGRQPRWVAHTGSLLLPAYQRLDAVDRTSLIGTPPWCTPRRGHHHHHHHHSKSPPSSDAATCKEPNWPRVRMTRRPAHLEGIRGRGTAAATLTVASSRKLLSNQEICMIPQMKNPAIRPVADPVSLARRKSGAGVGAVPRHEFLFCTFTAHPSTDIPQPASQPAALPPPARRRISRLQVVDAQNGPEGEAFFAPVGHPLGLPTASSPTT